MPLSITVTLPKKMPLSKRILEASKQISDWLDSLGAQLNDKKERLQLTKCEIKDDEFCYHYSIVTRLESSAYDIR
jgi:hypothetical protein